MGWGSTCVSVMSPCCESALLHPAALRLAVVQYNTSGFMPNIMLYRQCGLAAIDVAQVS
jgi:hypothetical protein